MNKLVIFLIYLAFAKALLAQQDPQYTQYIYNPTIINPAYAGSKDVPSILALYRAQWVGFEGAPVTKLLNAHLPLSDYNLGLGLNVWMDEIGPARETYSNADISYTIYFDRGRKLAFGLKAGIHVLDVDFNRTNIFDRTDTELQNIINNRLAPNVGLGLFYYTAKSYVGLSAPNILRTQHFDDNSTISSESFIAREEIHFYAIAGHIIPINDEVKFKPATLIKYVENAPLQLDLTANFLFYDRFTLGIAYRWNAALSGLAAFQIDQNFLVGIAYDREVTQLGNTTFNSGSFEVLLRYEMFDKVDVMQSPRFF